MSRIILLLGLIFICAVTAGAQEGYFPFVAPQRLGEGSAIRATWIEAPAGKRGPVTIRDGHFYTGKQRIRFLGVNLAWEACFPNKEDAETTARRLSQLGVNLARFHFLDANSPRGLITNGPTSRGLDPVLLDKLDYFIARLKAHGVYSDIGLHCTREFKEADAVPEADKLPTHSKYVTLFDARLIELQKEFARKLLTHRNSYTGNSYSRESAIALIEITNENSFYYAWPQGKLDNLPPYYAAELDARYNDWRKALGQPPAERPHFGDKSPLAPQYLQFLGTLENRYFNKMHRFIKADLQALAQVTGTMAFGPAGLAVQQQTSYVDCHAYWEHPIYARGNWTGPWTIRNTPMVASPSDNSLARLAAVRMEGRPFTVSEYQHPFPSFYDCEALPLAAAYAARQDWDALVLFNYSANGIWDKEKIAGFFEVDGHPVKTAELLAASAIFVRQDVAPAPTARLQRIDEEKMPLTTATRQWWDVSGMLRDLGLELPAPDARHYVRFCEGDPLVPMELPAGGDYSWTGDGKQGLMTASFLASKAAVGFFTGSPIDLQGVSLAISTGFAAVTATALDGKPMERSAKILLTACGRSMNTGMKWNEAHNSLDSWGTAPALAQGVKGRVEMDGEFTVFALDAAGKPGRRVTTDISSNRTAFDIGPEYQALWYLAVRQPGYKTTAQ